MKRLIGLMAFAALAVVWAAGAGAEPYLDGANYLDYVDVGDVISEGGHNLQTWGAIQPDTALPGNTTAYGGIYPGSCRPIWAGEPRYASLELDFGQTGAVMMSIRHLDGQAAENDSFEGYIGAMTGDPLFSYTGTGGDEVWYWLNSRIDGYTGVQTLYLKVPDGIDPWSGYATYGQMCIDQIGLTPLATLAPNPVDSDPIACGETKQVDFRFRKGPDEIRGYSVRVACSPELSFDETDVVFHTQPAGATIQTFVTENVTGSDYTVDCTVMGGSVGIPDDVDLFSIDFHGVSEGTGTVSMTDGTLGALDGAPVTLIFDQSAEVVMDCTSPDPATMDTELLYTPGATNTVSWSDESASGAAEYYCECSDDGFATVFANSGWIAGLSHEFTGLADGTTYSYRVMCRDAVLNESAWSATESSTQDATAPETAIEPEPFWVESFFDVTYRIDLEDGSGVASVELFYSKDGGAWTSWGPMATQTVEFDASTLGEGEYRFYSIGTDEVGNVESPPGGDGYDALTNVDATAPATRVDDPGLYQVDSFFDITYVVDLEEGSGVASVTLYYSKDGGDWTGYGDFELDTPLTVDVTGLGGDGVYGWYCVAVDSVGNVEAAPETADATTIVDTVGPTVVSFAIDGGAAYTADLDVVLNSDVSGATEMRFSDDGTWGGDEEGWIIVVVDHAHTLPAGADGTRTVYAEYRDEAGNVAPASDDIVLDTTAPDPVTDITASRGNDKITVEWTNPGQDETLVELWRGFWYHYAAGPDTVSAYPEYDDWPDDEIPPRPLNRDEALLSPYWAPFDTVYVAVPSAAIDDNRGDGLPRGIYYYEAFAQDGAGNWSGPAAENDYATSYLLGDLTGDGLIDLGADIGAGLALCYGTADGEPSYDNECDVGPTDDYSGDGIPLTDDLIGFEDLMIFALNFDVGLAKSPPAEGVLAAVLGWMRIDDDTWALHLVEPCLDLKGLLLQADLPAGAVTSAGAGKLLADQIGPCFVQNIGRNGLDLGAAVLGGGVRVAGTGELLRLSASGFDPADVEITARNTANELIDVMFAAEGVLPQLPSEYELSANYPNPFNPSTKIDFALPDPQQVKLVIYAVDGRRIATIVDRDLPAGRHSVTWTGRDDRGETVASGIYFYRIVAGPFSRTCKMTLLK